MKFLKQYLTILFCFLSATLIAQKDNYLDAKKHRFSFYMGLGPNYYFNNLDIGKNYVQPWNYSLTARLMWEPEHFLSLGIESGYYQLYTIKFPTTSSETAQMTNIAIPIQLVISMKFLKNYYTELSIGQTNLISKFSSSTKSNSEFNTWSLSDFGLTAGYKHPLNHYLSVGAESKFFHSSKNRDNNLALVFIVAFNF